MTHQVDDDMMFAAINRWEATAPITLLTDIGAMKKHFLNEHGIQFNSWINLTGPRVVDEKKYVMFLLRYSCE